MRPHIGPCDFDVGERVVRAQLRRNYQHGFGVFFSVFGQVYWVLSRSVLPSAFDQLDPAS